FGSVVLKNHKGAMDCAAHFPADRILLETDAPYQPLQGKTFSSYLDLGDICAGLAALRKQAGSPGGESEDLEAITTANFYSVFNVK
ncbi:MAG: TatD family hydrolase, partial [Treponema sp.]|nr:TatD family hydrolase [Treponema sp.]